MSPAARLAESANQCWSLRSLITHQCFYGFLIICSLVIFTPLLFTEKVHPNDKEFYNSKVHSSLWSDALSFIIKRNSSVKTDRRYSIQPQSCSTSSWTPNLILFIPSRPQNADERAAVRETWGFHARLCHVRIIFGMGSVVSAEQQHELFIESTVYGDLLQTADVADAYHNQTRLILSFFQWASNNCDGVKFIGKADEDSWINVFGVLRYLSLPVAENSVVGHFLWNEHVKRRVEEKWYLTKEEYSGDMYPPFAVGQLYIFPSTWMPSVLRAADKLTLHWLDDVYIGGQVPELLGMDLLHVAERAHLWELGGYDCPGRYYYVIHATPGDRKRELFYDACMSSYREQVCQASTSIQTIDPNFIRHSNQTVDPERISTLEMPPFQTAVTNASIPGNHTRSMRRDA